MSAVLAPSADPVPPFQITILTHAARSLRLAKRWRLEDGKPVVDGYEDAKTYRVSHKPVTCLMDFVQLLRDLKTDPYSCMIHGELRPEKVGLDVVHRDLAHFQPRPTQLLVLDVDSYESFFVNPLADPAGAVADFIESQLPAEFQGVSYAFKLSGSFGQKQGLLKCHIFMWLDNPLYPEQLKAYVRNRSLPVDTAVFRTVQAVYTADPVFDDGLKDPAPYRVRYVRGQRESLTLELSQADLSGAEVHMDGSVDLTDPCEKPGLIGAFHRAFTMEEVIDRWLSNVFEFQQGSDRRLNFLQGGGAAGGAWVHESRQYIQNTHNSCPLGGRMTNKWDLVRHYVYGHLDAGLDAFELLDVAGRPSHKAMEEMVAELKQVKVAVEKTQLEVFDRIISMVNTAPSREVLLGPVIEELVNAERDLKVLQRDQILTALKDKCVSEKWPKLTQKLINDLVQEAKQQRRNEQELLVPEQGWWSRLRFVLNQDCWLDTSDETLLTYKGLNNRFINEIPPGQDGTVPPAVNWLANNGIQLLELFDLMYLPGEQQEFEYEGKRYWNTYKPVYYEPLFFLEPEEQRFVDMLNQYFESLVPDARSRELLKSYLAHNVKFPGKKILWAVFIHGEQGTGKSTLGVLLAAALGQKNVGKFDFDALESKYNGFATGACVRVLDEAKQYNLSPHAVSAKIKALITDPTVNLNEKFEKSRTVVNSTNYLMFSNFANSIPLEDGDRRFMVLETGASQKPEFNRTLHDLIRKFPHIVHWYFMNVEIHPEFQAQGQAPVTWEKQFLQDADEFNEAKVLNELIEDEDAICVNPTYVVYAYLKQHFLDRGFRGVNAQQLKVLLNRKGYKQHHWKVKEGSGSGKAHRLWIKEGVNFEDAKTLFQKETAAFKPF